MESSNLPNEMGQSSVHERTVEFAAAGKVSTPVKVGGFTAGLIRFPAEFSADTITFQSCYTKGGTYAAIIAASATISTPTAATWYPIPAACFGGNYLKVVTGTETDAAATVTLQLKTNS